MNKTLKESLNGEVVKKYLPNIYKDGQFLYEEDIDIIVVLVNCNDKIIKLVKPRESAYSRLFVKDKVVLNKYLITGTYEDYIKNIKKYIYNYNSDNPNKEKIFEKNKISKEEFDKKPLGIIDYEIDFNLSKANM